MAAVGEGPTLDQMLRVPGSQAPGQPEGVGCSQGTHLGACPTVSTAHCPQHGPTVPDAQTHHPPNQLWPSPPWRLRSGGGGGRMGLGQIWQPIMLQQQYTNRLRCTWPCLQSQLSFPAFGFPICTLMVNCSTSAPSAHQTVDAASPVLKHLAL